MSPPSKFKKVEVNTPPPATTAKKPTHKGCTCEQVAGGWLSPRMLHHLQTQAQHATQTTSTATTSLLPHLPIDLLPYSNFIPPPILRHHLHTAFYRGFTSVFQTAHTLLARSPTPMINAEVLKANVPRTSETAYFFSKGGRTEHVLDAITYNAGVRAAEDEYFKELPPCSLHDLDFATVRNKMGLSSEKSWGPYYHVECDKEEWEAGGNVEIRRSDIKVETSTSDSPFEPEPWDVGDVIDWGEGMNASEMEASDRALGELNKFLEKLLPGVC